MVLCLMPSVNVVVLFMVTNCSYGDYGDGGGDRYVWYLWVGYRAA